MMSDSSQSELDALKAKAAALDAEIEAKHAEVDAVWDEIRRLTPPTPVVTHAATGTVISPEIEALRQRVETAEKEQGELGITVDRLRKQIAHIIGERDAERARADAAEKERDYAEQRADALGDSLNAEAKAHQETLAKLVDAEQALQGHRVLDETYALQAAEKERATWETPFTGIVETKRLLEQERDKWRESAFAVEQEKRRECQRADAAEELLRIAKEALERIAATASYPDAVDAANESHDIARAAIAHLDTPASPPARPRPGVITGSSRQDGPLESPAEVSKRLASEFVNSARAALAPTPAYTLENGLIFGPDGDSFATVDAIREHDAALLVHFANKAYTLTEYEQRRDAPPPARNNRAAAEELLRAVLQHRIAGTVGMFIVPDALLHRIAAALNREAAR